MFRAIAEKYIRPIMTSGLMVRDPADMDVDELAHVYLAVKYLKERSENRMKAIRKILLKKAESFGTDTEHGGKMLTVSNTKVFRERRQSPMPEEDAIRTLMEERGLKVSDVFSKTTVVVLDPSKLQEMVDLGKLPKDKVEEARKVTWALRLRESYEVKDILDSMDTPKSEEPSGPTSKKRPKAIGSRKGK